MVNEFSVTFANGQSLSTEIIDCSGGYEKAIAILFQAGYNTTNCTFQAYTQDEVVSAPVLDLNGNEYELTVDQTNGNYIPLDPAIFAGIAKFKIRRGTLAVPFTTGAENTVIKVMKRIY